MSFDLLNPATVEHLQQYDFALIRGITETTREGIRGVITRAFEEGGHPYEQAREIRDMVGLLPRQIDAVERYRDLLESEDRDSDQIDRMVSRYEERLLNDRARNIARTETIRASTEGRQAAWEQAVEEGLLDAGTLKQWIVTADDKTCPVCLDLGDKYKDGIPLDDEFESEDGSFDGPPAHPSCRCTSTLIINRE